MNILFSLFFALPFSLCFGQPSPQESYPEKIKAITEQLKTDSLNYKLIWEKLEMKVNLMGMFKSPDEIFSINPKSSDWTKLRELHFDEFNADFNKIFNNIIKEKRYEIAEEGEFYLNRMCFYFDMMEIDNAIKDARYLKDSASYTCYWQTRDYYDNSALYSLFSLYVIDKRYKEALGAIDTMLEMRKKRTPEIYYSGHGSGLGYQDKIHLFEHFDRVNEIIPYLKENCKEHFKWYFENEKSKDYYTEETKHQGFFMLKQTVEYMKKYNDEELLPKRMSLIKTE